MNQFEKKFCAASGLLFLAEFWETWSSEVADSSWRNAVNFVSARTTAFHHRNVHQQSRSSVLRNQRLRHSHNSNPVCGGCWRSSPSTSHSESCPFCAPHDNAF